VRTKKVAKAARQGMGARVRVYEGASIQQFAISHFQFYISRTLAHLDDGTSVEVRCDLTSQRHPHPYAQKSLLTDSAVRLGVHAEGIDRHGNSFSGWLQSKGDFEVLKMNAFVDVLEGVDLETSIRLPRRWVPHPTQE